MTVHPLAWSLWLAGVCVLAAKSSNPLPAAVGFAAVLLVSFAGTRSDARLRGFLVLGGVLLVIRLGFLALLGAPGATTVVVLPKLSLLGVTLGGRVTAESLAEGGTEGLRLLLVLVAFAVWNSRVDVAAATRMLPQALREMGLVVSVAVAFVPSLLRTASDVRDAQRLRGERARRLTAPALAVPVLGMTLERAMLLAESMESRGYGRSAGAAPSRHVIHLSLGALVAGLALRASSVRAGGDVLLAAGVAGIVVALWHSGRTSRVTRLAPPRWNGAAIVIAAGGLAMCAAVFLADVSWTAYPLLTMPPSGWAQVSAGLLAGLPVAVGAPR